MFRAMEYLEFGHSLWLVATSFLVALVAGATGLTLTKDLSRQSVTHRKMSVTLAAIALGGGIWSMHFVAMLGLQLPILFYYDAAITLVSALFAILMVAIALVLLHFWPRTKGTITLAGVIVGFGILVMHYIGMAGMNLCRPVYTVFGVVSSSVLAIAFCIAAFWIAYNTRTNRSIAMGSVCFGVAVFAVHFLAMSNTNFVPTDQIREFGPLISNEVLAIGVILSSFVIFGAFLWVGTTFLLPSTQAEAAPEEPDVEEVQPEPVAARPARGGIPCEREGSQISLAAEEVLFVRADGHYCQVYTMEDRYFCAWPITEATKRLVPNGFLKVHRSYLINPQKVTRFERDKDKGQCTFESDRVPPVPVSRSHLKDTQAALG